MVFTAESVQWFRYFFCMKGGLKGSFFLVSHPVLTGGVGWGMGWGLHIIQHSKGIIDRWPIQQ